MPSFSELRGETVIPPGAERGARSEDGAAVRPRRSSANRRLGLSLAVVVLAMLVMTIAAAVAIHIAGNPQFTF